MARGPKRHLKRLVAPKSWMLDKLSGTFAPRPSCGPHKLRECLPLIIFLRNRLRYAQGRREVMSILKQRIIKVDNCIRTDCKFPAGLMDVISIEPTGENFRLLYDTKGRFIVHRIVKNEAEFKLCKVTKVCVGSKNIPYVVTHDGRTIRYPDPLIKANDTVKFDLQNKVITEFIKFEVGNIVMVTGGYSRGRVGIMTKVDIHPGSYTIVYVKDSRGDTFATRLSNVFVIGHGNEPMIELPKQKGVKISVIEEREERVKAKFEVKHDSDYDSEEDVDSDPGDVEI